MSDSGRKQPFGPALNGSNLLFLWGVCFRLRTQPVDTTYSLRQGERRVLQMKYPPRIHYTQADKAY
jgi:hypothetical protein